ncbi:hypothetical protein Fmac_007486 [Flemingia macrophylla]|uniref:Uncharacterized protein n=1 Tax=Flemingia macrophylla TaxID=520843 RepID=A0ABD1MUQ3_9FABA
MLCSAQTGKSGLNWLDRLRSSKGIPTGDDPDLDSFLLTAHSQSPQAPPNPPSHPRPKPKPISTVLAELFNVGAALTQTYHKCPRKQTNPKIFLPSSSSSAAVARAPFTAAAAAAAAPSAHDAAVPQAAEEAAADRGDEEEEGNELKGFTKSEVTVIDTSCPGWKVDKFVFRKNNVWKVRERKPKTKISAKRKTSSALAPCDLHLNAIQTSKDNVINMRGDKPAKTQKVI